MTPATERSAPRRSEVEGVVVRGPARESFLPLPDAARLGRELRRCSCDGRDAASSAARRVGAAVSEGDDLGPLPAREAAAIQLAIGRIGRPEALSAPFARLAEMLQAEYGTPPA